MTDKLMADAVDLYERFKNIGDTDSGKRCEAAREFLSALERLRNAPHEAVLVSDLGEHVTEVHANATWQMEKEAEVKKHIEEFCD